MWYLADIPGVAAAVGVVNSISREVRGRLGRNG